MSGFEHSPHDAPWRRQEIDTPASWNAFKHYAMCGPERTLDRTAHAIGHKNNRTCKDWSSKKQWVVRADAYDTWLMERGDRDKKHAEDIAAYGKDLQTVYEDTMRASQALLKISINELVKMQKRMNEDNGPEIKLHELTKAITTALRAIDTSSSARGTLLSVDAIQSMFKVQ